MRSPVSKPRTFIETSSFPPPMSLFMVVILSVSLFVSSMFTGIKPSATTVALSRDSSISVFFTSILKRVSFGKRFLYSGKDPSSFLKDAENFSLYRCSSFSFEFIFIGSLVFSKSFIVSFNALNESIPMLFMGISDIVFVASL